MRTLQICFLLALATLEASSAPAQAAHAGPLGGTPQGPAANPFEMSPRGAPPPNAPIEETAIASERELASPERPILPFASILLEGETDARSWAFHLTPDEAANGASIAIGYQNAIVVMPEASRLRVAVNGEPVVDIPIASAQGVRRSVLPIRPGLLRGGQNVIRMEAIQRHRTDCTVDATYELWTRVDSAATGLILEGERTSALRSLEDLPAIGLDTTGITTIQVVAPDIHRPEIRDRLLRLVQLVALRGRYAHPVIRVAEKDPGPLPPGAIKVVMGIASELRGIVAALPATASAQPLAIIMPRAGPRTPILLVSGPTWDDLDAAIDSIGSSLAGLGATNRDRIDTASWHWPEAPTYLGDRSIPFADLGIPTQEFSGRRFKAGFVIDLPSDFYATDYGEATLFLDAAHTSVVKPGSHVQIQVNGTISATMMMSSRGNVFRRHPVRISMRNFKPGINHILLEASLLTEADERCAPGETLSDTNRFALFDSTSLHIPDFARIGRSPDLAVLSTGAFPYGKQPATLVLPRPDAQHYAAAGTLLARMARDAGAPVRAQFANAATDEDRSVVVVGALDGLPADLLGRTNVSDRLRTLWRTAPAPDPSESAEATLEREFADATLPLDGITLGASSPSATDEVRERWTESLQPRGIVRQTAGQLRDWAEQNLDLSPASLNWKSHGDVAYEPPQSSTLFLAQGYSDKAGTWTLVTAPTEEALTEGMERVTDPMLWSQVTGRAAALVANEAKLDVRPAGSHSFIQTQPFSLLNIRLVAANWLSGHIIQYALLMLLCCSVLGAATYLLLSRFGRRST